ncbi:MAG: DUF2946 family protein [Bdellovibrionota bacterium]
MSSHANKRFRLLGLLALLATFATPLLHAWEHASELAPWGASAPSAPSGTVSPSGETPLHQDVSHCTLCQVLHHSPAVFQNGFGVPLLQGTPVRLTEFPVSHRRGIDRTTRATRGPPL